MLPHKESTLTLGLETKPDQILFRHILGEYNYKRYTLFSFLSYIALCLGLIFQALFLASDIYTLIQIFALKNWDSFHTITYIPVIVYKVVFTTCIGISFLFQIFTWLRGIMFYKADRVVKSYLNNGARIIDSLRDYERFCIYQEISTHSFQDWLCLKVYQCYHYDIFNWLLADTPRQSLNGATIAYLVSNKFTDGNIGATLSYIGQHNQEEAVLLGFMFFSFVIWLCFTFQNVVIVLSSICVISSAKRRSGQTFTEYIHSIVAESVSIMYERKANAHEMRQKRRMPTVQEMSPIKESALEEDMEKTINDPFNIPLPTPAEQPSTEHVASPKASPYLQDINQSAYSKTNLLHHRTTRQETDTANPFEDTSDTSIHSKEPFDDSFGSYNELGSYVGPHFPDASNVYPEVELETGYPEVVLHQRYSVLEQPQVPTLEPADPQTSANPFEIPNTPISPERIPSAPERLSNSFEHNDRCDPRTQNYL